MWTFWIFLVWVLWPLFLLRAWSWSILCALQAFFGVWHHTMPQILNAFCAKSIATSKSMHCPLPQWSLSCFSRCSLSFSVFAPCGCGLDLPCAGNVSCQVTILKSINSLSKRNIIRPIDSWCDQKMSIAVCALSLSAWSHFVHFLGGDLCSSCSRVPPNWRLRMVIFARFFFIYFK